MHDLLSFPLSPAEDEPLLPEIPKCEANVLDTSVVIPGSWLSNTFRHILTYRSFVSEFHNFLLGLQLHTDYLQNGQFSMWKGAPYLAAGEGTNRCQGYHGDRIRNSSDHVHGVW